MLTYILIQVRASQICLLQGNPKHQSPFSTREAAPYNDVPCLISFPVKENNKTLAKGISYTNE